MIHAYAHETLRLIFSKAFRRKIKLIVYSDRAKISLQKYNLNLILRREILVQSFVRAHESRVHFQFEITTVLFTIVLSFYHLCIGRWIYCLETR